MRQGEWLPLLWMDNEQIHKDLLERELLLPDDTPQQIRAMAFQRWMQLQGQLMMKQSGLMLPMGGGAGAPQTPPSPGGQPPGQPGGQPLPPQGAGAGAGATPPQPFQNTNPAVKGGTYATMGGETDQTRLAPDFDRQIQGRKG